jgi:hypothetical protein
VPHCIRLRRVSEAIKRRYGVDGPGEHTVTLFVDEAELSAASDRALECLEADGRAHGVDFLNEAVRFTKTLSLCWAWLPLEIIQLFWIKAYEEIYLFKIYPEHRLSDEVAAVTGKAAELLIKVEAQMPYEDARRHVEQATKDFLDKVAPPRKQRLPRGRRLTDKDRAVICQAADWFYRIKVKQPAEHVYTIAQHESKGADPRRTVYDRVAMVEKYLDLSGYVLRWAT